MRRMPTWRVTMRAGTHEDDVLVVTINAADEHEARQQAEQIHNPDATGPWPPRLPGRKF